MKTRLYASLMLLGFVLLTACGGGGAPAPVNITPITSFTGSAAIITTGDSVNLTPVFTSGSTASIDNAIGTVTSGSTYTVSPTTTTIYTLTAVKADSSIFTSTVTVTVVPAPTFTSFTASASTIIAGQSLTLTPVFSNGTATIDNGVGTVISGTSYTVSPTITTTYQLVITNAASTAVSSPKTITVTPALDSLSIINGTLDQAFQSNSTAYTSTVGFLASSIKVKATTQAGATVKVNNVAIDANNLSTSIALTAGADTTINITVTKNTLTKSYVLTITRESSATLAQQAFIKATTPGANDSFGVSVSLDGDTLAVGADYEGATNSGAAYIFTRSGTTWTQQAKVKATIPGVSDFFGVSVSLNGDTLAVGAVLEDTGATDSGAAYIFTRSGTTWTQQAKIKATTPGAGDHFGWRVSLVDDTLAVAADYEDTGGADSGAAYIFTRSGTTWTQKAKLKATIPGASDRFGISLSLDVDTLAVSAPAEDTGGADSGAVYIFTRSGTTWTQQAKVKATTPGAGDLFGSSVSIDGDMLAVGAGYEDTGATDSGAAYIFTRSGTTWTQQAKLKATTPGAYDVLGGRSSIDIDGDTLAVGTSGEDTGGVDSGAAYIFTRSGTTWTQQAKLKATTPDDYDSFGGSVSLDGDTLAIGASGEDTSGTYSGAAYIIK